MQKRQLLLVTALPLLVLSLSCTSNQCGPGPDIKSTETPPIPNTVFVPQDVLNETNLGLAKLLTIFSDEDKALPDSQKRQARILRLGVLKGVLDFIIDSQDIGDMQTIIAISQRQANALRQTYGHDQEGKDAPTKDSIPRGGKFD